MRSQLWFGWREELRALDPDTREATATRIGELGRAGKPAGPVLAELLRDDPVDAVRNTAAWALAEIGNVRSEVIHALVDGLSMNEGIREAASRALRRLETDRVPKILAQRLSQEADPRIRTSICVVISMIGKRAEGVSGALAKSASRDENERVRSAALSALAQMGMSARRHSVAIRALLEDPSPHVRLRATLALRILLHEIHMGPAIELLDHQDPDVRHFALRVISGAGDYAGLAAKGVAGCLDDPDPKVAKLAAKIHDRLK